MRFRVMVGVAQLVEHLVVVPVVAGSSPVIHPMTEGRVPLGDAAFCREKTILSQRPR